jgi:dipeptidyl-peptidase 4
VVSTSLPRQYARTRRFTLGTPHDFTIAPNGERVAFLRTRSGDDPVTCLWVLELAAGKERLIADPGALLQDGDDQPPPEERAGSVCESSRPG